MGQDEIMTRIQRVTQRILEQGNDVQREMRDIALQAVRDGKLDRAHVAALVDAVMHGVKAARVDAVPPLPSSPLVQALRGLEDALSASAESLKLALQEAIRRTTQEGTEELQRGKNELSALQSLFMEVLKNLSQDTQQSAHQTWDEFAAHMTNTSTRLGDQLTEVTTELQRFLDNQAQNAARTASISAAQTVESLANTAARALNQLADALRNRADKK